MPLSLAISPCPNDTFVFHGLLAREVQSGSLSVETSFYDIHQLNGLIQRGEVDLCKVSSVAAIRCSESYQICSVGAALGYGVGPLIVARPGSLALTAQSRVLCPGNSTTAFALFRHFYPECVNIRHVVFSDIMPALARGEADYGVVIHEGRFTFEGFGLKREVDLGQLWEERYQLPLPLGCLVARRSLGGELIEQFEDVVRASLNYSLANKSEAYSTMRRYAQELDEAAIWGHVDLYVNQWSLELGELGTAAFKQLAQVCEEIETRAPGLGFL